MKNWSHIRTHTHRHRHERRTHQNTKPLSVSLCCCCCIDISFVCVFVCLLCKCCVPHLMHSQSQISLPQHNVCSCCRSASIMFLFLFWRSIFDFDFTHFPHHKSIDTTLLSESSEFYVHVQHVRISSLFLSLFLSRCLSLCEAPTVSTYYFLPAQVVLMCSLVFLFRCLISSPSLISGAHKMCFCFDFRVFKMPFNYENRFALTRSNALGTVRHSLRIFRTPDNRSCFAFHSLSAYYLVSVCVCWVASHFISFRFVASLEFRLLLNEFEMQQWQWMLLCVVRHSREWSRRTHSFNCMETSRNKFSGCCSSATSGYMFRIKCSIEFHTPTTHHSIVL